MSKNTITITLEGDVPLEDFSKGLTEFTLLLKDLNKEVSPEVNIEWIVTELLASSAQTTVEGIAPEPEPIERVVIAYGSVGQSLSQGKEIPYSRKIRQRAKTLTKLINSHITGIRFQTEEGEWLVSSKIDKGISSGLQYTFGTVKGRVQTITERRLLSFILYDSLFDKSVTCHVTDTEQQRELTRNIWGKRVVVAGRIGRSSKTGLPVVVRDITDIRILESIEPGNYKRAKGVLPWKEGDELPEQTIRKLRDA